MTLGPDWEAESSRLWQNSSISLSAIARQLCLGTERTGWAAAIHHAIRPWLDFGRRPDAAAHSCHGCLRFTEAERGQRLSAQLELDKQKWSRLIAEYPGLPVAKLKRTVPGAKSYS